MNFSFRTTEGTFRLPQDLRACWGLLFYYGGDFLGVSATELMALFSMAGEFARLDCRILAISGDSVAVHLAFLDTLHRYRWEGGIPVPLGWDEGLDFRREMGLDPHKKYLWLMKPGGEVAACFCYPLEVGVQFHEIHRTLLALQKNRPTPADWVPGASLLCPPPQTREDSREFMQKTEAQGGIAMDWYLGYEADDQSAE